MAISQKLHTRLVQKLILTPSLQQAIKLLPMSTLELKDLLNQEMVENPLLEEIPTEDTQVAEAQTTEEKPEEKKEPQRADTWDDADYQYFFGEYLDDGYRPRAPQEVKELPPIENTLSSSSSLADHLSWQLSLQTDDSVIREIGEAIIGNLDDDGALVASLDELAAMGPWPVEQVEQVLSDGAALRSGRGRGARPAGVPAAADPAPRARRHARRAHRHRASARAPESPDSGNLAQARDADRRAEDAHRDHPAPGSEAGQPLQPGAVAVRDAGRLRREDRRRVRRVAERGRPAADADQPDVSPAPRQGRGSRRGNARLRPRQVQRRALADQVGAAAAEHDLQRWPAAS
jgi:RNA polymerase sigma-54 factor